jgi:aminoglycoside/choline kinase family phosphotransferase
MHNPDPRLALVREWLTRDLRLNPERLEPASSDASFRRYFRVFLSDRTAVVMDAPPDRENVKPFIQVAGLLRSAGIRAPEILAQDIERGFLLLSDLGTQTYLDVLNGENADVLFAAAIDTLIRWQLATREGELPPYDEPLLRRELCLFPDWYVARHLQRQLGVEQRETLEITFSLLVRSALAQPKVYVHRDYMPRNLMVGASAPGVLDFQDAVIGPITYDVVSLFRDAFISWPEDKLLDWVVRYWERARSARLPVPDDFGAFYRDFEWMGLQRHLKVLGIFARINYRDGKPKYLADTPRFVSYASEVAARYDELRPLLHLVEQLHADAA